MWLFFLLFYISKPDISMRYCKKAFSLKSRLIGNRGTLALRITALRDLAELNFLGYLGVREPVAQRKAIT